MTLEAHQGAHGYVELAQLVGAPKLRQVHDKAGRQHFGPDPTQQLDGALGGSSGRDQIVHQDDTVAGRDRVLVHFPFVDAVFQRISNAHGVVRYRGGEAWGGGGGGISPFWGGGPRRAELGSAPPPPIMKPRASIPATLSIFIPAQGCTSSSIARRNARGEPSSVVMSRNRI